MRRGDAEAKMNDGTGSGLPSGPAHSISPAFIGNFSFRAAADSILCNRVVLKSLRRSDPSARQIRALPRLSVPGISPPSVLAFRDIQKVKSPYFEKYPFRVLSERY